VRHTEAVPQPLQPSIDDPAGGEQGSDPDLNPLALASLVLGMVWVYWLGSILAIVLGCMALRQIRRHRQTGAGLAIAGVVLGCVGMAVLVGALLLGVPIFTVS
jgi:hypothetical protein